MAVMEKTRKTRRYEIRLSSETRSKLFEMAKQEGKTAAEVMRELIRKQAEKQSQKQAERK
jgi:predicted DNA-binding protein